MLSTAWTRVLFVIAFLGSVQTSFSQGTAFGIMGGPTLGFQRWNAIDQQPLFAYHGLAFIETLDEYNVLYARAGFHLGAAPSETCGSICREAISSTCPPAIFSFEMR